jgi:hypothetical protein
LLKYFIIFFLISGSAFCQDKIPKSFNLDEFKLIVNKDILNEEYILYPDHSYIFKDTSNIKLWSDSVFIHNSKHDLIKISLNNIQGIAFRDITPPILGGTIGFGTGLAVGLIFLNIFGTGDREITLGQGLLFGLYTALPGAIIGAIIGSTIHNYIYYNLPYLDSNLKKKKLLKLLRENSTN